MILVLCATLIFGQNTTLTASDVNDLATTTSDEPTTESKKNDTTQPKPVGFVPLSRSDFSGMDIKDKAFSSSEKLSQEGRTHLPVYLPPLVSLESTAANVNSLAGPTVVEPVDEEDASSSTSITSGLRSGESTSYSASIITGPKENEITAANTNKPVPLKLETITSTTAKAEVIHPKEEVKEETSTEIAQPIKSYHTVIHPPTIQYIHSPKITYVPVSPKSLPLEHFNSFSAHPSSVFKYSPAPSYFKYSPTPVPVVTPIPVPVLYDGPDVETFHHSAPHFAIQSEPIPVPVISDSSVGYHSVPDHVVHAKSFVEDLYSPEGSHRHHVDHSAHIDHSGHSYESYSRAVSYSPASSVSSVQFNGLGASYGW